MCCLTILNSSKLDKSRYLIATNSKSMLAFIAIEYLVGFFFYCPNIIYRTQKSLPKILLSSSEKDSGIKFTKKNYTTQAAIQEKIFEFYLISCHWYKDKWRSFSKMARAVEQQKTDNLIDWEETSISGPNLAFHAGCVIGNYLLFRCIFGFQYKYKIRHQNLPFG